MGWTNIEGAPTHLYLGNRAHNKLDEILAADMSQHRSTVLVTHHPSFTEDMQYKDFCANLNFFQPIVEKFDAYCTGHSHVRSNHMHNGCLLINSGSDYDDPRYVIFEA